MSSHEKQTFEIKGSAEICNGKYTVYRIRGGMFSLQFQILERIGKVEIGTLGLFSPLCHLFQRFSPSLSSLVFF